MSLISWHNLRIKVSLVQENGFEPDKHTPDQIPSTSKERKKGIHLKVLDAAKLRQLTPKEKKHYYICTRLVKKIGLLRKRLRIIEQTDSIRRICEDENVIKLLNLNMTNSFIVLLQSQLKNCPKRRQRQKYNLKQKLLALKIYKKSPAYYRLLRRMFALPSQSTLNKLLNGIPLKTGINEEIFKRLKGMADCQLDYDNTCILIFDEMALTTSLQYNEQLDLIEGYEDLGNHGRINQIACTALLFMLAGVQKKWKQPLAFYFFGKSLTSHKLCVIIKEVLHECFNAGLSVVGTVCDMSTVNMQALDALGSSADKPYFYHEGREIVTILDPPNLLKCTRNNFLKYNVECISKLRFDGKTVIGVAKWSHVKSFYDADKNSSFAFAPALRENHIAPNAKQKMKVNLAAEVFSHKVAVGILAKVASKEIPSEAHATAALCSRFDQLFDALNSDSPRVERKQSSKIKEHSPNFIFFEETKKFITRMKFLGAKSPPPCQLGWIRSINAVERLWTNLRSNMRIRSPSTRRLNKDPLRNCFGCIRFYCGSNKHPTVSQFMAGIKTAILCDLKNCEDDMAILCHMKSFLK